jgi:hypothetical protein
MRMQRHGATRSPYPSPNLSRLLHLPQISQCSAAALAGITVQHPAFKAVAAATHSKPHTLCRSCWQPPQYPPTSTPQCSRSCSFSFYASVLSLHLLILQFSLLAVPAHAWLGKHSLAIMFLQCLRRCHLKHPSRNTPMLQRLCPSAQLLTCATCCYLSNCSCGGTASFGCFDS